MAVQVAAYHLRVKERYRGVYEFLDSIGKTHDFLHFAEKTFETCKTNHHNDVVSERIALTDRVEVNGRVIEGRIEVGDYGKAGNVRNASDAKTVFRKTKRHADSLPIFFRLQVDKDRDEALLIIEKTRKTSAKTAFVAMLRFHFEQQFPEYVLSIAPVMPEGVFAEYLKKGQVRKISFVRMGIPSDIVDLLSSGHEELTGSTKFVVTASRNRYLPIKRSVLNSKNPLRAIQDLYELRDLDYQNVQVEVAIGQNHRNIDLGRKHASPLYDITAEVTIGSDGNPTYESMSDAFKDLAADIELGAYETA